MRIQLNIEIIYLLITSLEFLYRYLFTIITIAIVVIAEWYLCLLTRFTNNLAIMLQYDIIVTCQNLLYLSIYIVIYTNVRFLRNL